MISKSQSSNLTIVFLHVKSPLAIHINGYEMDALRDFSLFQLHGTDIS